jgi:hypothetical protein
MKKSEVESVPILTNLPYRNCDMFGGLWLSNQHRNFVLIQTKPYTQNISVFVFFARVFVRFHGSKNVTNVMFIYYEECK